ncbi:MAG: hypothetical protein IT423_19970, partial [Pirellulaceae bacterium]|nr:hypothetical protein [Pirellulaceae bacterium]
MRRYTKELAMLLAAVGLLLLGIYWLSPPRVPRTPPLKMTAGDATGLRHKLALELAKEVQRHGITIDVQPTNGSEAAIEGLRNGDFDLAFVQGGLASENMPEVRQLTAMHIEPLHLLVKSRLFERIEQAGLRELGGCTVNLGPVGSGTQILATAVLKFTGLHAATTTSSLNESKAVDLSSTLDMSTNSASQIYQPVAMSYQELMSSTAEDLPDAIFTVSTLPSPLADFLIETRDYRLVPLPFGEALSLEAFLQLGEPLSVGS